MKLRAWYAVWAASERKVSPAELWAALRPKVSGIVAEPAFTLKTWDEVRSKIAIDVGSETPSFDLAEHCVFRVEKTGETLMQVRWVRDADAVRKRAKEMHDWVESMDDELNKAAVVTHLKQTCQIISVTPFPRTIGIDRKARICEQLCGYLARECRGLIHVEAAGIFNRDGKSFFPYNPEHCLSAASSST